MSERQRLCARLEAREIKQAARPDVWQLAQDAADDCNNAGHCNANGHVLVCCWPCLFDLVESLVPVPRG